MKARFSATEPNAATTPAFWQREGPIACLRVELSAEETHLFSYQHFVTASLMRAANGVETVRIAFSSQEVEVVGFGLRELLLGLQDLGVNWLRTAPERYHALHAGAAGVVTAIRITTAE